MNEKDKMEFIHIQEIADGIVAEDEDRNAMFLKMQDIYKQNWQEKPNHIPIEPITSPSGHNVIRGMVNILSGSEPTFDIPCLDENDEDEKQRSLVEKGLKALFRSVDDVRGRPLGADMAFTGGLCDMIALKMDLTSNHADTLQKYADKKGSKRDKKRLDKQVKYYDELSDHHPFLVEAPTMGTVFARGGAGGLRYLVEKRQRTVYDIREEFGETACPYSKLSDLVWYYEYWDRYQQCKWSEASDEPFLLEEYDVPGVIPYVVQYVNGNDLMKGRMELFPTLYPVWKGRIWNSENLAMSLWLYVLFNLGNPTYLAKGDTAKKVQIDKSVIGQTIPLDQGDTIEPLVSNTDIVAQFAAFFQQVQAIGEDSTVNRMVFGKAPANVLAYSTVNLLVQGGRHGIIALQIAMSKAGTDLARKMLRWIKESGKEVNIYGGDYLAKLAPDDIDGAALMVKAEYKPDIPQDRLQTANMAKMLVDSKLLSRYTARSLAGNNQPDEEEDRIVREQVRELMTQFEMEALRKEMLPEEPPAPQSPPPPPAPETQPAPNAMEFIPPPLGPEMPTERPGFIGQEMNNPMVQALGAPPEEFQQAAAGNMNQVVKRPGEPD